MTECDDENGLRTLMKIAHTLVRAFEDQTGVALPPGAMMWPPLGEEEDFPTGPDGAPRYPSAELGGVAGLHHWLSEQNLGEVVFANDLSWEVRGVDAVVRDRHSDRYILCEAKGTTPVRSPTHPCTTCVEPVPRAGNCPGNGAGSPWSTTLWSPPPPPPSSP